MSFPAADPHRDEPVVELDPNEWLLYQQALRNAEGWKKEADRWRAKVEKRLGDAYAGTINGVKVVTYRPTARYAETRLCQDYPNLVPHFIRSVAQDVFNVARFAEAHPDIAERYRVRSFRQVPVNDPSE